MLNSPFVSYRIRLASIGRYDIGTMLSVAAHHIQACIVIVSCVLTEISREVRTHQQGTRWMCVGWRLRAWSKKSSELRRSPSHR